MIKIIINKLNTISIKVKMPFTFIIISLISAVLITSITYNYNTENIEEDVYNIIEESNVRLVNYLDYLLLVNLKSAKHFLNSDIIFDWFQKEDQTSDINTEINSSLKFFLNTSQNEILGITIIHENGKLLSSNDDSINIMKTDFTYNIHTQDSVTEISIIPRTYIKYNYHTVENFISILVPVKHNEEKIGYAIIDISLDSINNLLHASTVEKGSVLAILSNNNDFLYLNNRSQNNEANILHSLQGIDISDKNDMEKNNIEKSIINVNKSKLNIFTIVNIIPHEILFSNSAYAPNTFLSTLFIITLSILLLAMALSTYFIDPILDLQDLMKEVESGNFNVRTTFIYGNDEIQRLKKSFNDMVIRLDHFFNVVSELKLKEAHLQIKEKEALIQALQSQINPHFLYNSLDIIKSIAYLENVPQIVNMSKGLADFYRYTARNSSEEVTLEDEITYVRQYLSLIQVRFPKHFNSRIDVDDQLMRCKVIKLMIQPIVENSVKYAIEPNKGRGYVNITVDELNEKLRIIISDNGPGLSENLRIQLQNQFDRVSNNFQIKDITNESLGLINVHARIILKYGPEYGIVLAPPETIGTSIIIYLPLALDDSKGN